MPDHADSTDSSHNPTYQCVCPQDGCRGILMFLHGEGRSVCCYCGALCVRGDELIYDIGVTPPRQLGDDEIAALRRQS